LNWSKFAKVTRETKVALLFCNTLLLL